MTPSPARNPVGLLAAALGLFSLVLAPPWLLFKAHRLAPGEPHTLLALAPPWAGLLVASWLLLAVACTRPFRGRAWAMAALATLALVAVLVSIAQGTAALLDGAARSARVTLGGGVWLSLLAAYTAFFAAWGEASGSAWRRLALVMPALLFAGAFVLSGNLSELGLARELAAQGANVTAELWRHLGLALTGVLLGTVIGVPAAIAAVRQPRVAALVLPTAGFLQTLPSLALFGLMLAPLARLGQSLTLGEALLWIAGGLAALALGSRLTRTLPVHLRPPFIGSLAVLAVVPLALAMVIAAVLLNDLLVALLSLNPGSFQPRLVSSATLAELGVRGIGTAPALIALTLYALLPIVRNTYTGFLEVPQAVIEAGRGMGMSPRQLLWRVELPLALPLLIEGIRASAVLCIGIATVAYLIGAGGLGVFIQRGIDQVVPDLILLGAIPVILLALAADGALRALGLLLTSKGIRS